MHKTMNLKGFVLILGIMLAVFLVAHLVLRGNMNATAEKENTLRVALTRLQEENKDLDNQLRVVGTDGYIVSSAMQNYDYVRQNAIRFVFTNPDALDAYSEEEMRIYLDETGDQ
jgi:hypothetical protein